MTSTSNNDHYFGAILEDIQSKLDFLAEVVSGLATKLNDVDIRLRRVEKVVDETLPVLKAIAKEHSIQLDNHEDRIELLEAQ